MQNGITNFIGSYFFLYLAIPISNVSNNIYLRFRVYIIKNLKFVRACI